MEAEGSSRDVTFRLPSPPLRVLLPILLKLDSIQRNQCVRSGYLLFPRNSTQKGETSEAPPLAHRLEQTK